MAGYNWYICTPTTTKMYSSMSTTDLQQLRTAVKNNSNELLQPMLETGSLPPIDRPGQRLLQLECQLFQIEAELASRANSGIRGSPPRKTVSRFSARRCAETAAIVFPRVKLPPVETAVITEAVPYVPPGGHPWFKYRPEQVV